MRLKIIQETTLTALEREINAWLEDNPRIKIISGQIHHEGDWRSCYAVLWYKEE